MPDLGAPTSYLTLERGVPVLTSAGVELGRVTHVLAMPDHDIFDGLVVDADGTPRFVDASIVHEMHERGVVLRPDVTTADALPVPSENPPQLSVDPDDTVPDDLGDKLRRAWDVLSGRT
ncbi:MAG: hypothetical protein AB7G37_13800 [Solirubrobacteraceae bacterium]